MFETEMLRAQRTAAPAPPAGEAGGGFRAKVAPLIHGLTGLVALAPGDHQETAIRTPFTGEIIGTVPACTGIDVQYAATRAREAQRAWAARPLPERRKVFLRYHDLVLDHQEQLLDLVQIEGGKARKHALEEVYDVALNARYYAQHAGEYLRPRRRQGFVPILTVAWEHRHPLGLVGIISPWNYPLTMAVSDAIPALVAGNAVMLKPAELTPLSALCAIRLLYEAGLPRDLFQIITGRGRDIGASLIQHSSFVSFTGSTEVGRLVAERAAAGFIRASLELGGKNPLIVLDDADLERAVLGAMQSSFASAGQLCVSSERLYVQDGIYDRFVGEFVRRTSALRLGAALDYSVDLGSLASQEQLRKAVEHVEDAVAKGATLLTGGRARPDLGPCFFEPTVLVGVKPGMRCYREETFGPVAAVYRVGSAEEAIAAANDCDYGLNACIWTRDLRRGRELAARVQCGTVNLNDPYAASWGSPGVSMGGMKCSGMGRRHGSEGIHKYTETQAIVAAPIATLFPPFGISYELTARYFPVLLRMMKHIPGLR